jgi:hypothetical protein
MSATCSAATAPDSSARHVVEGAHLFLALRGKPGLFPQARGELADHQRHDQHHGEGNQVLGIGHRHRVMRRHEEEVEQGDATEGRQDRRPAAQPGRHQRHHQQEDHDDVGGIDGAAQRQRQQGRHGTGQGCLQVAAAHWRWIRLGHESMLRPAI